MAGFRRFGRAVKKGSFAGLRGIGKVVKNGSLALVCGCLGLCVLAVFVVGGVCQIVISTGVLLLRLAWSICSCVVFVAVGW
ncbi:hypothetical protein N7465_005994 [Penicillium sp. CMV-2018d]|nr:hypothetical protein N7465_005994 [Penicillium sp. CMV-2018d]